MYLPLIILGKLIGLFSRFFNLGSGRTWPGEIALRFNSNMLFVLLEQLSHEVVLIAGTNGKTTTALMIKTVLEKNGYKVIHNKSGANLINGLVSAFIEEASWMGKINADYGVLEVDENTLPSVISNLCSLVIPASEPVSRWMPDQVRHDSSVKRSFIIVLLNLFRDQLDRYGEVDVIAEKWEKSLRQCSEQTLILNADDPLIAYLGTKVKSKVKYFGLGNDSDYKKELEHATDSIFCLRCGSRLKYRKIFYSHLGDWICEKCSLERPKSSVHDYPSPLPGTYNNYNTQAAVATLLTLGIKENTVKSAISSFSPAFGRQEEFTVDGKKIKIFLSKNPTGFNESIRTVISLGARHILFVLNDRIPDGRDVSWIWDVDFEMLPNNLEIIVSGDRVYDLAIRLKYAQKAQNSNLKMQNHNSKLKTYENLEKAIKYALNQVNNRETLYVLPTYSSMLEVRKILTGKKIL